MSWASLRRTAPVVLLSLSAVHCAKGVKGPELDASLPDPEDSSVPMDAGIDSSSTTDAGVDSATDSGTPVDGSGPLIDGGTLCTNDLQPNVCEAASSRTISVPLGAMMLVSGIGDARGDDFFVAEFPGYPGPGAAWHPKVALTANPNNIYELSFQSACGVDWPSCDTSLTSLEMAYPADQASCAGPGTCTDPVPPVASVIVRVHRKTAPTSCFGYTVQVSNVP